MEVKKATVFASVLLLTFMLAGGYYLQVRGPCQAAFGGASTMQDLAKAALAPAEVHGARPMDLHGARPTTAWVEARRRLCSVLEIIFRHIFACGLLSLLGANMKQYIPPFINWIKYISFTWYAYRLLLKVQFSPAETYSCGPNLALQCPMQSAPAFKNVTLSDAWVDALALLAQVVIYRGFAYIALRRMKLAK